MTHAIRLHPGYVAAFYNRALLRFRIGAREEAIADLRKAATLNPSYIPARKALEVMGIKQ